MSKAIFSDPGTDTAAVVTHWQYTAPNQQFVDYMRDHFGDDGVTKVAPEDLDRIKEQILNQSGQTTDHGYDKTDLNGYVDYMKRDYATAAATPELLPTFNGQKLNFTPTDEQQLRDQLDQAQANGSMLWQGVVSFRHDWLKQQGAIDEQGVVDQSQIKRAIQAAMPDLIRDEGLSADAFWWADVHLNTDHVHVHIGLSEVHSARPRVANHEVRGNMQAAHFDDLKRTVANTLSREPERAKQLQWEHELGQLRTQLLAQQERQLPTDLRQNARLKRAYQRLPTDPKVKSISSNAKVFAASRQAIEAYVATTLAQSTAYQTWQTTGQALGTRFTTLYGQRGQDYLEKQRRELKKRLGNQVLRALYASDSEPIGHTDRPQTEAELTDIIMQRTRQLKQTQQPAEQQQIKQELAKLKYRLRRQRGLAQAEAFTTARQALLDQRLPASPLQNAQLTALAEQAQLVQLKIRPQRRLTAVQKQTLTQLNARYYHANDGNYTRQGIEPVTEQVFQLANRRVTETLALIEQTPGPMVSQIYGQPVTTIKKRLQIEQQALRLKHAVNMNNQQLKVGHEGAWQQQNHQLIEQLRKLALPSNPESRGGQQWVPSLRRQYQQMEPVSNSNLRARQPTRQAMHAINQLMAVDSRAQMRALRAHERDEDRDQEVERGELLDH